VYLIIKSGILFTWSAQPSILTVATIILDDYLKTNPGVKDLPRPGIKPQPHSPQSDGITIRPWRPHIKVQIENIIIKCCPTCSLTYFLSVTINVSWEAIKIPTIEDDKKSPSFSCLLKILPVSFCFSIFYQIK